jgi:hypothetical protein
MKNVQTVVTIVVLAGCVLFMCVSARGDWNDTDPVKWSHLQLPDLTDTGMDIKTGTTGAQLQFLPLTKKVLADDFECTREGPITDIHIWGSWNGDFFPGGEGGVVIGPDPVNANLVFSPPDPGSLSFHLGIWDDVPAGAGGDPEFSTPGQLLWERDFAPGQFAVREVNSPPEDWYDPNTQQWEDDNHLRAFQYNFEIDPADAYRQTGTTANPKVYWLSVDAIPSGPFVIAENGLPNATGPQTVRDIFIGEAISTEFGWKTTHPANHWNDDATFSDWTQDITSGEWTQTTEWGEMRYPEGHQFGPGDLDDFGQSIDLAFVITPEPATMIIFVVGLPFLLARRRKS